MKSYYLEILQAGNPIEGASVYGSDKAGKSIGGATYSDADGYLILDLKPEINYITASYVGAKITIPTPANLSETVRINLPISTGTDLKEVEIKATKKPKPSMLEQYWYVIPVLIGVILVGAVLWKTRTK